MLSYSLLNRSILQISGEDSKSFLQGLVTQDINLVTTDNSSFSLLLTNKGRYLLDFFIIKDNNGFLIDISSTDLPLLEQTLKHYKLRSKVTITVSKDLKVYAIFANISQALTINNQITITNNNAIIIPDCRLQALGLRVITNNKDFIKEQASNIIKSYYNIPENSNITLVDESEYHKLRYLLVVPEATELIKEKSIPLECGLDELNAISFNKGCYLGQEFTNSSKRTLVIRKRLLTFKANINLEDSYKKEQIEQIATHSEEKVGTIIAAHNYYIMALVKIDYIKNNSDFFVNKINVESVIPDHLKKYFL